MKRKLISLVLSIALVSFALGCQSIPEEHRGAAVGAGVGAAAGTAAGAVLGKSITAAVVGGLVGALIGGAIGHYAYDKQRTREQTVEAYNYDPSSGTVLTIEKAWASPQTVRPGDTVNLNITYAVLTPSQGAATRITEVRELRHDGNLVGRPETRVDREDGTYPLRSP